MSLLKCRNERRDPQAAEFAGRRHAQHAADRAAAIAHQRFGMLDLGQDAQHLRMKLRTVVGERLLPRRPVQQAHAESRLEMREPLADDRQRQVELARRRRQAAGRHDPREGIERREIVDQRHGVHLAETFPFFE